MNTFGEKFRLTTFGESHGPAVGGVIDGVPSGLRIDFDRIRGWLDRRRTGSSPLVSSRKEDDIPEFLSGISPDGLALGSPIAFVVRNSGQRSADYDALCNVYRPNHADYTYEAKYGLRDWRGGGRASARETVSRVVAGAIASSILDRYGVSVEAGVIAVGGAPPLPFVERMASDGSFVFPESLPEAMRCEVERARVGGDSVGAVVGGIIKGLPRGLGDPVYGKMQARLASAMFSINAVKGFDYGSGFDAAAARGTEQADIFVADSSAAVTESADEVPSLSTLTNHSGGIQGGITNGMPVYFRVAFKPTPSVASELPTVDSSGRSVTLGVRGRHDPCVGLRGAVVVEAMAAIVAADLLLSQSNPLVWK